MAIAGSGGWIPSVRVSVHRRQLVQSGAHCNVYPSVVWFPEHAAALFIDNPRAFVYVPVADGGGIEYLHALLVELDMIDALDKLMVWKYA